MKGETRTLVSFDTARPFIDHNHKTGKVRGILCPGCNSKLSALEDKSFLQKATEYLDYWETEECEQKLKEAAAL